MGKLREQYHRILDLCDQRESLPYVKNEDGEEEMRQIRLNLSNVAIRMEEKSERLKELRDSMQYSEEYNNFN